MKNLFSALLLLVTILSMGSCASQRALTGKVETVSARLETHVRAFNLDEKAGGNIRLKRGEAIQISLTKFGIEGVRIVCTPDSILFVNKLSKTYLRTSFREADQALMGGDGTLNFKNVEAYFWNDSHRRSDDAVLPVGGFFPIALHTDYGRSLRVGDYRLPLKIEMEMNAAEGTIETGKLQMKLSKVKAVNDWTPNTQVSAKYKSLNFVKLIRSLLQKGK